MTWMMHKEKYSQILAAVLLTQIFLGCGEGVSPSPGSDGKTPQIQVPKAPVENDRQNRKQEIERRLEKARQAVKDRDFLRAEKLIGHGLGVIEKNGAGLESTKAELLLELGNVKREIGDDAEARRYYADATAIFHVQKDTNGRFATFLALGQLEARRGDYANATRQYALAEELLSQVDDRRLQGVYSLQKGRLFSRKVEHEKAKEAFLEAIKIFEATRDKAQMTETLLLLAKEEDALGRIGAAKRHLDRALAIFRELEDLDGEARSLHRLAGIAEREKKYAWARQLLNKVYDLYVKLDRRTAATSLKRHINALPESD